MIEPTQESAETGTAASGSGVTMRALPGAMLREAREAQGLHIAALAVALKVSVKKLEALEADRLELLPDLVFVRALALSVCRTLKLDSAPVMAALPQLQAPQIKTDEAGLNTTFTPAGGGAHHALLTQLKSPVGMGVLFFLLAIGVLLFWPSKMTTDNAKLVIHESDTGGLNMPMSSSSQNTPVSAVAASSMAEPSSASLPSTVPVVNVAAANPTSATPTVAPVSASSTAMTLPQQELQVLSLQARGASWVEVTDAKGATLLRKTTADGDVLQVSGPLPLTVVLGRADLISVTVRGKPMELTAVTKDNVARFEVK